MIRLLIALLLLPSMANAAIPDCYRHQELELLLQQRHQESLDQFGLTVTGQLMELFTTEDGSTWTMVLTDPDGTACLVAAGEHWMKIADKDEEL